MSTKLLPPDRNSAARLIPGVGNLIHMNKVSQLVSKISSIFLLTIVHSRQTAVPNLPITSTMHSPTKTLFFFLTLLPDVTQTTLPQSEFGPTRDPRCPKTSSSARSGGAAAANPHSHVLPALSS